MANNEVKQTEFNSSQATLQRIHNNFVIVTQARAQKNYELWIDALDSNWTEIAVYLPEMTEQFRQEISKSKQDCNKHFNSLKYASMKLKETFDGSLINIINQINYLLKRELDNYEVLLRVVMDKKKLLMTDKASASEAVYEEE